MLCHSSPLTGALAENGKLFCPSSLFQRKTCLFASQHLSLSTNFNSDCLFHTTLFYSSQSPSHGASTTGRMRLFAPLFTLALAGSVLGQLLQQEIRGEHLLAFYPFESGAHNVARGAAEVPASHGIISGASKTFGHEGSGFQFDSSAHIDFQLDVNYARYPNLTMGAWVRVSDSNVGSPSFDEVR